MTNGAKPLKKSNSEALSQKNMEEFERIGREIEKRAKNNEQIRIIAGAFGEHMGCEGYVEDGPIFPREGGMFYKLYGCSYLYKGFPDSRVINALGMPKTLLSTISKELLKGKLLTATLVFNFMFGRRKLIHAIRVLLHEFYRKFISKSIVLKRDHYTNVVRHTRGAFVEVMRKTFDLNVDSLQILEESVEYIGKREKFIILAICAEIFYQIIEYDNAYRYRYQDIIEELNHENVKRDVYAELDRLKRIMVKRNTGNINKRKTEHFFNIIKYAMKIDKDIRKLVKAFLLELEIDAIKMDETDRYYSADRSSYNHGGKTLEERMEWRKKIDEEKGHVRFHLEFKNK